MAELVTLSAPVVTPNVSTLRIASLLLDWDNQNIAINLRDNNGGVVVRGYSGPTAVTFMTALNKMNLSTSSLHKRVMERLIADGLLAGVVSGSPD